MTGKKGAGAFGSTRAKKLEEGDSRLSQVQRPRQPGPPQAHRLPFLGHAAIENESWERENKGLHCTLPKPLPEGPPG